MTSTVLITGAHSFIGQNLINSLNREEFKIIAGLAQADTLDSSLKTQCHQVIELDFDSSSSILKAFEDQQIDYLFLIPSKSEERALEAKRLITVGIENNVKFIVLVSLLDCHARTGILAAQFRYIEQYIEATGVPFTILRLHYFNI